ncbi:UNVERIFIED_CONTAM: hypothetical protein RMT77_000997 [Armadillidium vulgare]
MTEVQKLYFIFALYLVIFQSQGVEGKIKCYSCYYFGSNETIPGSDENCLNKDLGDHLNPDLQVLSNFTTCVTRARYEEGNLVGVLRAGLYLDLGLGPVALNKAIQDSSPVDTKTFANYLCKSDLCNSIPHSTSYEDTCNGASSFGQIFFLVLLTGALVFFRDLKMIPSLFI